MGIPFLSSPAPQPPPQQIFNNPSFSGQPNPEKYQYHQEVESFKDDLLSFKARLEGKKIGYDKDNNILFLPVLDENNTQIKPFANAIGRHEIYSFLDTRLKSTITLTNMDIKRFFELMEDDHKKLAITCYLNGDTWEIDDDRWEEIHFSILDMIENARRRSIDNEERTWITKMLNIVQSITGDKPKPASGLGDMFKTK